MYRIYDKETAIREVQKYLSLLSKDNFFIAPSGIYDLITRSAIRRFQEIHNLSVTGITDYPTFQKLYDEYRRELERKRLAELFGFLISFPILPGQYSEELYSIHRRMEKLLAFYGQHSELPESNFYSQKTSNAVSILREIYRLEEIDAIDEILYSTMLRDLNSISGFEE